MTLICSLETIKAINLVSFRLEKLETKQRRLRKILPVNFHLKRHTLQFYPCTKVLEPPCKVYQTAQ